MPQSAAPPARARHIPWTAAHTPPLTGRRKAPLRRCRSAFRAARACLREAMPSVLNSEALALGQIHQQLADLDPLLAFAERGPDRGPDRLQFHAHDDFLDRADR